MQVLLAQRLKNHMFLLAHELSSLRETKTTPKGYLLLACSQHPRNLLFFLSSFEVTSASINSLWLPSSRGWKSFTCVFFLLWARFLIARPHTWQRRVHFSVPRVLEFNFSANPLEWERNKADMASRSRVCWWSDPVKETLFSAGIRNHITKMSKTDRLLPRVVVIGESAANRDFCPNKLQTATYETNTSLIFYGLFHCIFSSVASVYFFTVGLLQMFTPWSPTGNFC